MLRKLIAVILISFIVTLLGLAYSDYLESQLELYYLIRMIFLGAVFFVSCFFLSFPATGAKFITRSFILKFTIGSSMVFVAVLISMFYRYQGVNESNPNYYESGLAIGLIISPLILALNFRENVGQSRPESTTVITKVISILAVVVVIFLFNSLRILISKHI